MAREYQLYDVFVYHDFDSYVMPHVGMKAEELGFPEGRFVVALGPAIHEGRAGTVVLADGNRPMPEVQALLDAPREN